MTFVVTIAQDKHPSVIPNVYDRSQVPRRCIREQFRIELDRIRVNRFSLRIQPRFRILIDNDVESNVDTDSKKRFAFSRKRMIVHLRNSRRIDDEDTRLIQGERSRTYANVYERREFGLASLEQAFLARNGACLSCNPCILARYTLVTPEWPAITTSWILNEARFSLRTRHWVGRVYMRA